MPKYSTPQHYLNRLFSYVLLIVVGLTMIFPLAWMVLTSLRPQGAAMTGLNFESFSLHWENYVNVWSQTHFDRALFNSVLVTLSVTVLQVATSMMAAYAFSRLRFRGRDKIFLGYLGTMMIPQVITMIPLFILFSYVGLINTYWAMILPAAFTAYGTFMLRQFFLGIPKELDEAAMIDGCGSVRIFMHVVAPLSKPAVAALAILTFMTSWRSFIWPLVVAQSQDMFTLPVALAQFQNIHGVQWALLMAGSTIMIIPMLIVFVVGQRYFVSGIQLGAVKG